MFMDTLSLAQVVELGYKEVIVQVDGYTEGRVFQSWQPFKTTRNIPFSIIDWGDGTYGLDHKTFWIAGNEMDMPYYLENGKVYLRDAEIMADIDY